MPIKFKSLFHFFLITCSFSFSWAKVVHYELAIENNAASFFGKQADFALTVNGTIPGPTLEFTEGDEAEIVVKNKLSKGEVSIHWHGLLLPPSEDGVPYVNTPPIFPGKERIFRFPIRQNGTYWYHSHTGLQEQKGVYGGIVIHPRKKNIFADKELVVVLSDWSNEPPEKIIGHLRKDGDYYLHKKGTVRSIGGAWAAGQLGTYFKNEWDRMGDMDLSDIGYDGFLINGKPDSQLLETFPGQKVRIRIINGAASTYFNLALGRSEFEVISADGKDIEPLHSREILMGMAETYDILFTMPKAIPVPNDGAACTRMLLHK
jgi:FtsP/CotA-like multicopper oxidase with cupredoxin domain